MRFAIRLDLFQGEKTEQATPKKERDARQKGQVPQSREANGAVALLVLIVFLNFFGPYFMERFFTHYMMVMEKCTAPWKVFEPGNFIVFVAQIMWDMLLMIGPIVLVVMVTGIALNYMQVGFLFTAEPLKFKLDRINPLSGFKRMFSMRALVELAKSSTKSAVMIYITYVYLRDKQALLVNLFDMDPWIMGATMWKTIFDIVVRNAVFLIVVALFDYIYARHEHNKQLKMSKQEIKEEYKQTEGDPLIKSKIKERQRQMSMRRMMQDVPKADVVITNPTHFAIAIEYKNDKDAAPRIVAKGQDLIALNIRKIAEANRVPVVENKVLARTLYQAVQIGDYVPPDLYQAVAEVLAYVYNLKKR